jgi:two-component system KDP operon response regulator KdpE
MSGIGDLPLWYSEFVRVLLVEDDDDLRAAIANDAIGWSRRVAPGRGAIEVDEACDERTAIERLAARPDLVIVDVTLRDGTGIGVVEAARAMHAPGVFVAISGTASASDGFALAALGVRAYLAKPFTTDELRETVRGALAERPDPESTAADEVGRTAMHIVQDRVRRDMLSQALTRTDWNFTQSAKLLGVTRQAIQQMVRRFELHPDRDVH